MALPESQQTMIDTEVHIVPGPSAGGCLRAGLGLAPDLLLVNHDLLSCGPLPPLDSLDDWRDVRQAYLRSLDGEDPTFAFAEESRDLLTNPERLRAAEMITLWIGTGLAEQLLLVWVVAFLRRLGVDTAKFQTVQFDRDRKYEIVSVGVLKPSQFKDHPIRRNSMTPPCERRPTHGRPLTAPEAEALLTILTARERFLPFLQRSLFALLYRYPDLGTGLNAWEYQLLRYVNEEGPKPTRIVGYTMGHDMDFPDWVGDSYLFQRLHRLADAALPRPLLTLSGDTETLRGTLVQLTRDGADVLAGKANAVEWNGIGAKADYARADSAVAASAPFRSREGGLEGPLRRQPPVLNRCGGEVVPLRQRCAICNSPDLTGAHFVQRES